MFFKSIFNCCRLLIRKSEIVQRIILIICIIFLSSVCVFAAGDTGLNYYRVMAVDGAPVYASPDSTSIEIIDVIRRGDVVKLSPTYDDSTKKAWLKNWMMDNKYGYVKKTDVEYCYTELGGSYARPESTETSYDDIIHGSGQFFLPYCPQDVLLAIICILCVAIAFILIKTESASRQYLILHSALQVVLLLAEFYLLNNEYKYTGSLLSVIVIMIQLLSIRRIFNALSRHLNCPADWKWPFLSLPVFVFVIVLFLITEYNGVKTGVSGNVIFVPQMIFIIISVSSALRYCRNASNKIAYMALAVFYIGAVILLTFLIGRMCCPLLQLGQAFGSLVLYIMFLIAYQCCSKLG